MGSATVTERTAEGPTGLIMHNDLQLGCQYLSRCHHCSSSNRNTSIGLYYYSTTTIRNTSIGLFWR